MAPPAPTIEPTDLARNQAQLVYVLWPLADEFVKIGTTRDLRTRIIDIQTGNPRRLVLLAALYSTDRGWDEETLHERFAPWWVSGEWYRLAGDVDTWLRPTIEEVTRHGDSRRP